MAVLKYKAKVGDYVKIIKKLPYKDQKYDVDIGDIGIINYVASTGKYSVQIKGKKNPHDVAGTQQRAYGKLYDFWIPFECCEVVDNEELTRQCLFENADAFDTCVSVTTIDSSCYSTIGVATSSVGITDRTTTTTTFDCSGISYNYLKEREENKMKEIKNQKIVDLYFKRKEEVLKEEFEIINKSIVDADKHHIFMQDLKYQFETYLKNNEIKDKTAFPMNESKEKVFFPVLPLTDESKDKQTEAHNDYKKRVDELNNIKEEILAMLYGCDTYEQEMEILQTYKIVNYNTHYVSMNKIDVNETN